MHGSSRRMGESLVSRRQQRLQDEGTAVWGEENEKVYCNNRNDWKRKEAGDVSDMAGYLFVHFIGEQEDGEQIYFSISRDGLHWTDLNGGKPILYSRKGELGVRDPYPVRNPVDGKCYLIATDLRIQAGKGWTAAQEQGSRDLMVWESMDLIHWSEQRACRVGLPEAGCVWAPEAIYDRDKEAFLVFFASMVKEKGETKGKQRIYAAYTRDFREFSDTFLYMERENHVIDTTILESGGKYYRISKDETEKVLLLEQADSLLGNFTRIQSPVLDALKGVEGPEGYLLPDRKTWCLIADRFAEGKGYLPMVTEDLSSGEFRILEPDQYDLGLAKKRHGGVLTITEEEYERLWQQFGTANPVAEGLYADPNLYYEDGTYYLYPTTDGFPHWSGNSFYVFTSRDGRHFERREKILDVASDQVPWAVGSAWAPCIAKRGGTYYYYFCAKDAGGTSCIGVAEADSPAGPFRAAAEPIVTMEMMGRNGIVMGQTIDPSVYEEDGVWYLLFGNGHAAMARLREDMLGIREDTLQTIDGLTDFRESVILLKRGGLYHFTWSCDDTGSEDYHVNYGVSEVLGGPVVFQGTILRKDASRGIFGTGHHSILKMPGEDRYLIAYHRFATPLEQYPEGKGWHRELCLAPLTFDQNGMMLPVVVSG